MKKKILFLIILVALFFSYNVIYTYDTFHYLNYVDILFGRVPFKSWDIVRGPSFPLTIYLFNLIFGENQNVHLLLQFLSYLILLFLLNKFLNDIIDAKHKSLIKGIIIFLLAFNPIIFGYYHVLLTEFVVITLTMLAIYMSYKWIYIEKTKEKIFYSIFFVITLVYLWFLKQPYVLCLLVPMIIGGIIAFFKNKNLKNFLYRISTLISSLVIMAISIVIWNTILIKNNVDMNTGRDSNNMLSSVLLQLGSYKVIDSKTTNIDDYNLMDKEIKSIKKNKYIILLTYKNNKIIDKDIIKKYKGKLKTTDVFIKTIENIFQNPSTIIGSYAHNYCALTSVCLINSDDSINYYVTDKYDFNNLYENNTIGYRIFRNDIENNEFWVPERFAVNIEKYHVHKNVGKINKMFILMIPVYNYVYKFILLLNPLLLIGAIILYVIINLRYKELIKKAELNLICIGFSFIYLIANSYVNALIDRYSLESFIPSLLCLIITVILITNIVSKKNLKKIKK